MSKTKLITGILLVLTILFAQVGTAFAAPDTQATSVTGKVTAILLVTDATGVVTAVDVTLLDEALGTTQTVRLSLDAAQNIYGLVTVDSVTGNPIVDESKIDTTVIIQSTDIQPNEETPDEPVNPVAAILAKFFDLDPVVVQGYHEEGFGFGVIAQALWMQKSLADDEVTPEMILQAKKNKDFSSIILPDGSNPTNWGQFKKALLDKKNNLGVIVSGHADNGTDDLNQTGKNNGNGHGKDNNPGKGKGNNKP